MCHEKAHKIHVKTRECFTLPVGARALQRRMFPVWSVPQKSETYHQSSVLLVQVLLQSCLKVLYCEAIDVLSHNCEFMNVICDLSQLRIP